MPASNHKIADQRTLALLQTRSALKNQISFTIIPVPSEKEETIVEKGEIKAIPNRRRERRPLTDRNRLCRENEKNRDSIYPTTKVRYCSNKGALN